MSPGSHRRFASRCRGGSVDPVRGDRRALCQYRWPRFGAGSVALGLGGLLLVEEVDRLAGAVEQHHAELALRRLNDGPVRSRGLQPLMSRSAWACWSPASTAWRSWLATSVRMRSVHQRRQGRRSRGRPAWPRIQRVRDDPHRSRPPSDGLTVSPAGPKELVPSPIGKRLAVQKRVAGELCSHVTELAPFATPRRVDRDVL
jgi:hypothetical protein